MYSSYLKRPVDIVVAAISLALALPILLVIAVAIRVTSHGPAIFAQTRSGRGGSSFTMYKFRTMSHDNDVYDASKANHMTAIGSVLRATSLDELPQLWNVLCGDMSFIGPRPWITAYYDHMDDNQRRRYDVRPGITGIAQVYGRNNLTIHQKINYDLRYVNYIGLREDVKVLFLTFVAVLSKDGEAIGKGGIHQELDILKRQFEKHQAVDSDSDVQSKTKEAQTA